MASSVLLRRQFTPTSMTVKRSISALASLVLNKPISTISTISPNLNPIKIADFPARRNDGVLKYNSPARFGFTASFSSQAAGFAEADYSDDEKLSSNGSSEEVLEISNLNIHEDVVSCLTKRGITTLFPIQKAVLEPAMQGRDLIGRAKTGTGKTLAFGIPILDKITRHNAQHGRGRGPLALVLAPTRELAKQVDKEFYESSKLDTLCVYGGSPIGQQMSVLSGGVDVVAGTPGRVIDLIKRGAIDLSSVQFLVLDEADQMLSVGFEEAVETILEKLPKSRQTLMFSATMPNWIVKLTEKYLKNPLTIDLIGESDQKLAEGISLNSIVVDHRTKAGVIGPLFTEYANGGKCIVFTKTKRDADNLAHAMGRKNYKCSPLHGDIAQANRERTLKRFRDGEINILIATDVAARGLDIPNVDLVIHYELPPNSESFVHRSGRTGRAGKKGTAILIHTMDESRNASNIERAVGCKFKQLPQVATDGVELDMSSGFGGGGGRFVSGGRSGNSGFSRPGGYGNSSYGSSGGYGNSSYGSSGGYGNSSYGSSGGYSGSNRSGSFGSYGGSPRSSGGGYGGSSQGGYGNSSFGKTGSGFGTYGNTDRSSSFSGGSQSSSGFGNARSNRYSSFGDDQF